MNEEIDIIELLQRVKEGKAPKEIEINGIVYERNTDEIFRDIVDLMYQHYRGLDEPVDWWIDDKDITLDTKIKILDKPIIEELPKWITQRDGEVTQSEGKRLEMAEKINEIIEVLNGRNL